MPPRPLNPRSLAQHPYGTEVRTMVDALVASAAVDEPSGAVGPREVDRSSDVDDRELLGACRFNGHGELEQAGCVDARHPADESKRGEADHGREAMRVVGTSALGRA